MNDKPCWITNSDLWGDYSDTYKSVNGFRPQPVFMSEEEVRIDLVYLQGHLERELQAFRDYQLEFPPCREVSPKLWVRFLREFNKQTPGDYIDDSLDVQCVKNWLGDHGVLEFMPHKGKNWVFVPAN